MLFLQTLVEVGAKHELNYEVLTWDFGQIFVVQEQKLYIERKTHAWDLRCSSLQKVGLSNSTSDHDNFISLYIFIPISWSRLKKGLTTIVYILYREIGAIS